MLSSNIMFYMIIEEAPDWLRDGDVMQLFLDKYEQSDVPMQKLRIPAASLVLSPHNCIDCRDYLIEYKSKEAEFWIYREQLDNHPLSRVPASDPNFPSTIWTILAEQWSRE